MGARELKQSVGGDFSLAKKTYPAILGEFRRRVDAVAEKCPPATLVAPSSATIDNAARVFHATMMRRTALDGPTKIDGGLGDTNDLSAMIAIASKQAASGAAGSMQLQARWLCDQHDWDVEDGSSVFNEICEKLIRARLDWLRQEQHRQAAIYSERPAADPLFKASTNHSTSSTVCTVGDLVDEYQKRELIGLSASTVKNYKNRH